MPRTKTPKHDHMPLAGGALTQHLKAKHGLSDEAIAKIKAPAEWHLSKHEEAKTKARTRANVA